MAVGIAKIEAREVFRVALLVPLALFGLSCSGAGPSAPPNVVLIVVDTLRADHLGIYGAERDTSPNIDRLAAESVLFERAYSTAPWTKPAVASMMSGLYPTRHRVESLNSVFPAEIETLAEILSSQGYATAGVVSHKLISKVFGFAQGFDIYLDSEARGHEYVSSPGVTTQAKELMSQLARREQPFFLFAHYFDPHYSYRPHPEFGFAGEPPGRLTRVTSIEQFRQRLDLVTEAELDHLTALYDEEIRFTDENIGLLLAHLEALGLDSNTIVVLTGDHGEEFMERDWIGHVRTVYDELVRVPLLVRAPSKAARSIASPVSLASLLPTLLDLLEIEANDPSEAPSLAALMSGESAEPVDYVLSEVNYDVRLDDPKKRAFKRALIGPRYKLIHSVKEDTYELYDLLDDVGESNDLAAREPETVARLRSELQARMRAMKAAGPESVDRELSDVEIEQLRALGYVGDPEE